MGDKHADDSLPRIGHRKALAEEGDVTGQFGYCPICRVRWPCKFAVTAGYAEEEIQSGMSQ